MIGHGTGLLMRKTGWQMRILISDGFGLQVCVVGTVGCHSDLHYNLHFFISSDLFVCLFVCLLEGPSTPIPHFEFAILALFRALHYQ